MQVKGTDGMGESIRNSGSTSTKKGGGGKKGGGRKGGSGGGGSSAPSYDWDSWYKGRANSLNGIYGSARGAYGDIEGIINGLYGTGESIYNQNKGLLNDWLGKAEGLYKENIGRIDNLKGEGTGIRDRNLNNLEDWKKVGTETRDRNLGDINNLENEGRGNYQNAFDKLTDYLNQGKSAAAENKGNVNNAYDTQNGLLQKMYQASIANLERVLNENIDKTNREAETAQRQTYINNKLQDRALGQQLSASGLTGGMSETARARLNNSYNTQLGNIRSTAADNVSNLRSNYLTNLTNAEVEKNKEAINMEQARAQLLNSINDRLTDVTGNYTNMYNNVNGDLTNFLTNITGLRNNVRDNYNTFYGNYTNAKNQVEENYRNFLTNVTGLYNTANDNWSQTNGNYAAQMAEVNNNWANFNSNIADSRISNRQSLASAEQAYYKAVDELNSQLFKNTGYTPNYGSISFNGSAYKPGYKAAASQDWYSPQGFSYNSVSTDGVSTPAYVNNPAAYQLVDTSKVSPAYNFAISQAGQAALQNMSNYGDINTMNAQFNPTYAQAVQNAINAGTYAKQSMQQAQEANNAQRYQRLLAQAEMQNKNGASAQDIVNTLVSNGMTDAATIKQIIGQLK